MCTTMMPAVLLGFDDDAVAELSVVLGGGVAACLAGDVAVSPTLSAGRPLATGETAGGRGVTPDELPTPEVEPTPLGDPVGLKLLLVEPADGVEPATVLSEPSLGASKVSANVAGCFVAGSTPGMTAMSKTVPVWSGATAKVQLAPSVDFKPLTHDVVTCGAADH